MTVIAVAHIAWVAGRYHVGSFDDDDAYLYMAKGIVGGTGLGGHLRNGVPLVAAYPPGYAYLLAPLVWLVGAGGGWWPERMLSVACVVAVFPLTRVYLRRRGASEPVCAVVLALLAVNPVLATYGSMVMAEAPFMVVFLLLLLAADRWSETSRTWSWAGVVTILAAAGVVWLKEAAVAMVVGLVVWLLWRRDVRKAAPRRPHLPSCCFPSWWPGCSPPRPSPGPATPTRSGGTTRVGCCTGSSSPCRSGWASCSSMRCRRASSPWTVPSPTMSPPSWSSAVWRPHRCGCSASSARWCGYGVMEPRQALLSSSSMPSSAWPTSTSSSGAPSSSFHW